MSTQLSTKKIVYGGIVAALVLVATWAVKFPIPVGSGYIHFGDAMVYLAGALFGPLGAVAAGIGSLLADIISGYAAYALPTFVIKTLDALAVALLFKQLKRAGDTLQVELFKFVPAAVLGGLVMVAGYFAFETFFYPEYAMINVPFNFIQAGAGILIAAVVYPFLKKLNLEI